VLSMVTLWYLPDVFVVSFRFFREKLLEVVKMEKKNRPFAKFMRGRFQISIFKFVQHLVMKDGTERDVERVSACVQHSKYNRRTGSWDNQSLWCDPAELGDLYGVLEYFRDSDIGVVHRRLSRDAEPQLK